MNDRYDAIYARQSIDKKDSISIESQIEFCKYDLKGGDFKEFRDKGYSGKNTARPAFQELMHEIEAGRVRKVLVYKLDRISRSLLDFANMMAVFRQHGVEFVSSTEKFDTSTPVGRAMLHICIVFAQLERETTQMRIADAMYSRSMKGFRLGTTPAGFHLVPYKLNGINTKMLEATEEQKQLILLIFQMYAKPECSYGDIVDCFDDNGYLLDGERLKRSTVKRILTNPSYVVADADIYEFYRNQGTEIVNDSVDFNGVGSCYLHKKQGAKNTDTTLNNFRLVLAPHSGIVPSDLWLVCAKKVLSNRTYQSARKVERTWLSGKVRCGHCKRALVVTQNGKGYSYFRCTLRKDNKNACEGAGKLKVPDFECLIEGALKERMKSFQALQKRAKTDPISPKLVECRIQLKLVEDEIEKIIDSLSGANAVLISYANQRIEALDLRRKALQNEIAELSFKEPFPEQIEKLTEYLGLWDELTLGDKRQVLDKMVDAICVTNDEIDIQWKI